MDVLSKFTAFCSRDGRDVLPATVLMVNFRRLTNEANRINGETNAHPSTGLSSSDDDDNNYYYSDIFHSMAALYATALPDMELEAIYGCLDKPSRSVIVVATDEAVMSYRKKHGGPDPIRRTMTNKGTPALEEVSNDANHIIDDDDIDGGYYCNIFSDSEDGGGEGDGEEEEVGVHDIEREEYVKRVMERRQSSTLIGLEDKLIGCVTFMRLSSKPGESSVQILLLSVRHRWRGYGVGEYLLSMTKDPSIVGHYDIILTYADHKAEKFFMRYGFTDDPIITTRHKTTVDYWENSTLMSYIPPYSANGISSLKSVDAIEEQIKMWRAMSMGSHCEQVRVMERLRQEVLLLHGKLQSQEEIIDTLNREVKESRNQKEILEIEFKTYRLKMQEKITTLMEERANGWLGNLELNKMQSKDNI